MVKNLSSSKTIRIYLLLFLLILVSGCKSITDLSSYRYDFSDNLPAGYLCPETLQWQNITCENCDNTENKDNSIQGFSIISHEIKEIKTKWTCIKVDLNTPGIKIVTVPETDYDKKKYSSEKEWPELISVKEFAKKNDTIIAFNATPFKNESVPHIGVGIVKVDGIEIFPPEENYSALCFTKTPLRAHIIENQYETEINQFDYAFGGFYQVLKNGELSTFKKSRRSRTCIGVNKEGNLLYILVATSSVNSLWDTKGLTFEECGIILKTLGASDAMHFDGGISSCLVINSNQIIKPLINRKIPIAIGLKK